MTGDLLRGLPSLGKEKTMRKILVLSLMALVPLTMMAKDDFFYIFLCIGQSNMVGQGKISPSDYIDDPNFLSLSAVDGPDRKMGEWRKAQPPLCRSNTGMSLVDFFGRTMRKNFNDKVRIGVIHVAVDGCAIDLFDKDGYKAYTDTIKPDWLKNEIAAYGGNPYGRLIEMARKAQEDGVIRGILLHQGETDAYNDLWLQKVKKIYGDIISDLNLDPKKVPLVAGEAVGADQFGVCAHANPTINRLPSVLPNSYVASSKGCEAGPDHLHFTTAGYRTLGTRYAIKMLQAMGFEITDGFTEQAQHIEKASIDVEASLVSNDVLHAVANSPLDKVEYVSFSGNVLKTIQLNGEREVNLDANLFPKEQHLVIVFYGKNGASTSVDLTR